MKLKAVSGIMLTLLLVGMLTLAFNIQPVKASGTIYVRADGSVDPDTAPISTVDNITYTFTDNIYDEIVVERDNIMVHGAGYTLQGTGSGTGIYLLHKSNVTIKYVKIMEFEYGIKLSGSSNNSICGNNITNNKRGIRLESYSNDNSIYGNNVTTNSIHGIWLSESSNNTLFGNNITNNNYGVMIDRSDNNDIIDNTMINTLKIPFNPNAPYNCIDGIHLYESGNCKIIGNIITKCSWVGIQLGHFTENNIVKNNTITDIGFLAGFNGIGLILLDCQNSTFSGNTVTKCRTGIYVWRSNDNTLYHNSFISNPRQVGLAYEPSNKLDNGYPPGGNYWSDYNGTDFYSGAYQNITGSDGIGDTPYVIDANNTDHYPLMYPWGAPPPTSCTLTIHSSPSGITFEVDDVSRITPWSETYDWGASVGLVMPVTHTVGEAMYYWNQWSDGNTSRSRTVAINTNITLTAYYTGPHYESTVTSLPITGITFTMNGTPQTTPYTERLLEGSYTLIMPETHNGYVWSHWLEDGDTNRIKTITLQGTTWTAVYEPAPPPLGGKAIPWIWLTIIILSLVLTVVYVKKRNRNYLPNKQSES